MSLHLYGFSNELVAGVRYMATHVDPCLVTIVGLMTATQQYSTEPLCLFDVVREEQSGYVREVPAVYEGFRNDCS